VRCSLVFLSSVQSEQLPFSPGSRSGQRAEVNAAVLDQWNGGSAPIRRVTPKVLSGREAIRGQQPDGTQPGPVRSHGRVAPDAHRASRPDDRSARGSAGGRRPGIRRSLEHYVGCATRALTRLSWWLVHSNVLACLKVPAA
jgi:hypothetical protein